ncbi:hypothetical protein [Brevibacillus laterosporus]|uniref:hypothetical protein n=1 Tax=Brevibacillus laterosporus TaxID=1465 RepID=UPI00215CE43B|nr:hypothetical protein [Brevibacillus laterosporus]MCR8994599.1 hypothetical protein [Brevibacillus laterosporus]
MLEFTNKVVGTAIIEKPLTEKDIEDIIVTAFEGGSNYWMGLDDSSDDMKAKPKGEPWSTWSTKLILEGKPVKLYDKEGTEDDRDWVITLDKLINGYKLNFIERPHDCDLEQGDAGTADCILQYALFGKLVFG